MANKKIFINRVDFDNFIYYPIYIDDSRRKKMFECFCSDVTKVSKLLLSDINKTSSVNHQQINSTFSYSVGNKLSITCEDLRGLIKKPNYLDDTEYANLLSRLAKDMARAANRAVCEYSSFDSMKVRQGVEYWNVELKDGINLSDANLWGDSFAKKFIWDAYIYIEIMRCLMGGNNSLNKYCESMFGLSTTESVRALFEVDNQWRILCGMDFLYNKSTLPLLNILFDIYNNVFNNTTSKYEFTRVSGNVKSNSIVAKVPRFNNKDSIPKKMLSEYGVEMENKIKEYFQDNYIYLSVMEIFMGVPELAHIHAISVFGLVEINKEPIKSFKKEIMLLWSEVKKKTSNSYSVNMSTLPLFDILYNIYMNVFYNPSNNIAIKSLQANGRTLDWENIEYFSKGSHD